MSGDVAALWCERRCCSLSSVSLWAPCSSVGGWTSMGPCRASHWGASRWVLGVVGVRSLQGVECQWSAGREVHRPPSFCTLSLSLANKTHLDALESLWPINTRTCMPKLQSKDGLVFSFLYCFSKPACTPTLPFCSRCYVHYMYQNSFWG